MSLSFFLYSRQLFFLKFVRRQLRLNLFPAIYLRDSSLWQIASIITFNLLKHLFCLGIKNLKTRWLIENLNNWMQLNVVKVNQIKTKQTTDFTFSWCFKAKTFYLLKNVSFSFHLTLPNIIFQTGLFNKIDLIAYITTELSWGKVWSDFTSIND